MTVIKAVTAERHNVVVKYEYLDMMAAPSTLVSVSKSLAWIRGDDSDT